MSTEKLNGLDLFSGIGGLTIALETWVRPVAYCEQDRYAIGVLLSRMYTGEIPVAPIWDDVLSLHGAMLPQIDIIYGGFPCQDISVAGTGKGLDGERSGLFRQIVRLAQEIKSPFLFLENVPAIRTRGLDIVIEELTQSGYDLRWTMLSAKDIGANHKRERWFLLANSDCRRLERSNCSSKENNNALFEGRSRSCKWWEIEPVVGRVANGIPNRVDRLKCLGNAVVPLQAKTAFEILLGLK